MKFVLEIEVNAKRNKKKVLDRVIERASDAVMKERTVKMVDVKGVIVEEPEEDEK